MFIESSETKRHTWSPTIIFDDLLMIKITEETIINKRIWFFKWKTTKSKIIFNGLNGDATKFLNANPHITMDGITDSFL